MRVHRRQFVIGPAPFLVDEEWTSAPIGEGFHLSYHQALPVAAARDRDGGVWYLLGIAVQTDPKRRAPLDEIASARPQEVDALTSTWAGRWGLFGGGSLRADSGALLSCFYSRSSHEGRLLVSSSAALLETLVDGGDPSPPLRYEVGMDWYPAPASRFAGIRRLLPSQALDLSDEERAVRHRPLVKGEAEASYDETLANVETSLRTAVRNLAASGAPLWLGLTGGYDSRLLLAAMWREGLDFTTFTWDIPGMARTDRVLPPLLARDAGVPHQLIERERFDEERLRTFDAHTALHTVELDRVLYPWGQYAQFPRGAIVIQTTLLEVGALYYHGKLPPQPANIAQSVEQAFGVSEHYPDSAAHREGLRDWAAWIDAHPEPAMDWRDRFYWEQRGAWAGSSFQASDLAEAEFVSPVNHESLMEAVLRIDPSRRRGKRWEVDLAYRMAPFATDHPYYLGGPHRFRRAASAWVHHPSKRRLTIGRVRSLAGRMRAAAPGSTT